MRFLMVLLLSGCTVSGSIGGPGKGVDPEALKAAFMQLDKNDAAFKAAIQSLDKQCVKHAVAQKAPTP